MDQSKDVFFPLSREPAFVTVPGKSFADSFLLGPGTWMFKIRVEGILLVRRSITIIFIFSETNSLLEYSQTNKREMSIQKIKSHTGVKNESGTCFKH